VEAGGGPRRGGAAGGQEGSLGRGLSVRPGQGFCGALRGQLGWERRPEYGNRSQQGSQGKWQIPLLCS